METASYKNYIWLYFPFLVSLGFSSNPIISYLIAWAGSFLIFYLSFFNRIKSTDPDIPLAEKILKPLYLTQIIFAGYMCCTSIFYFLDVLGYEYFDKIPGIVIDWDELQNTSTCQQFYVLGHAAFVHGILLFYKSVTNSQYQVKINNWPAFFLRVVLISAPLGLIFSKISGLAILGNSLEGLALVASTIAFALSIPKQSSTLIIVNGSIFGLMLIQALTSGFKEPVLVSVLMLGLFLYPFYKRLILATFIPLLLLLFTILPTYVNTFRSQNWGENVNAEVAREEALKKVRNGLEADEMKSTNWAFLTGRLSEIGLFTKYKRGIEEKGEYYGFEIIGQTAIALIPRILWDEKPITELMVMKRAIENGVISEESKVSAKPQYIVDGYLSGGLIGIWLAMFFYGAIAQLISNKAEQLFGGYLFGTTFVYTGMMRALWRGNCFEFIFNQIFYSFLGILILFFVFKYLGVLQEKANV